MTEVVSGDNWSYKTCKVRAKSPRNQRPGFFTGQMPFLSPHEECQNTEGNKVNTRLVLLSVCVSCPQWRMQWEAEGAAP